MVDKIKLFILIWLFVLFANQILLFGACFALYCIAAAVPHTLVVAYVLCSVIGFTSAGYQKVKKTINDGVDVLDEGINNLHGSVVDLDEKSGIWEEEQRIKIKAAKVQREKLNAAKEHHSKTEAAKEQKIRAEAAQEQRRKAEASEHQKISAKVAQEKRRKIGVAREQRIKAEAAYEKKRKAEAAEHKQIKTKVAQEQRKKIEVAKEQRINVEAAYEQKRKAEVAKDQWAKAEAAYELRLKSESAKIIQNENQGSARNQSLNISSGDTTTYNDNVHKNWSIFTNVDSLSASPIDINFDEEIDHASIKQSADKRFDSTTPLPIFSDPSAQNHSAAVLPGEADQSQKDVQEFAYITKSVYKKIMGSCIELDEKTPISQVFNELFDKNIGAFVNEQEARKLYTQIKYSTDSSLKLSVRKMYRNSNHVFDTKLPSYHTDIGCTFMRAKYTNFIVPAQISNQGEEKVREFKQYCESIKASYKDKKDDLFWANVGARFKISNIKPTPVEHENSGVVSTHEIPLEVLRSNANITFDTCVAFVESMKYGDLIKKYRYAPHYDKVSRTSTSDEKRIVKEFFESKWKLMNMLMDIHLIEESKTQFSISVELLDRIGIKECRGCLNKRIAGRVSSLDVEVQT